MTMGKPPLSKPQLPLLEDGRFTVTHGRDYCIYREKRPVSNMLSTGPGTQVLPLNICSVSWLVSTTPTTNTSGPRLTPEAPGHANLQSLLVGWACPPSSPHPPYLVG